MLGRRLAKSIVALAAALTAAAGAAASPVEAVAAGGLFKGICEPLSVSTAAAQAASVQLHCITLPGAQLVYEIVSQPQHGSVSLTPSTGQAIYTPAPGYSGPDSFTYTAERFGPIAAATVSIGVGQAPEPAEFDAHAA